jgi:hypothetical protein
MSFTNIADVLSAKYNILGLSGDAVQKLYKRYGPPEPTQRRKVIILGDVHANPHPGLTQMIIDEEPDIIVVAGDLFDMAALNSHGKDAQRATFKAELDVCRVFLKTLKEKTPARPIILMMGNHEKRLDAALAEFLPEDVLEAVSEVVNPLILAAKGIDGIEIADQPLPTHNANTGYWILVGDAVVSHMNFCGKRPGFAAQKLVEWYREWRRLLKLPDATVYVQLHGHKASLNWIEGGSAVAVEPGMAGDYPIEKYKLGYKAVWHPGTIGACVIEQELVGRNWVSDVRSVRLIQPSGEE